MEPVRTCVGCRTRAPRSALLRVVARGSDLVPDPRAAMPGRGAWLHPTPECVETAIRRRAFVRALRAPGPLATRELESYFRTTADRTGPPTGGETTRLRDETAETHGHEVNGSK
jgi:uncharacterized protein